MIIGQKLENWTFIENCNLTFGIDELLVLLYLIGFYQKCIFLGFDPLEKRIID